ncbi:MAG: PDZ domain-containing protein [Clostridiaceae bacterium]
MDLTMYVLRSVAYAIFGPYMILVILLLGIMFYLKNRKISFTQKMIIGGSVNSPLELTLSQFVLGIIAGAIGSLILTYFGVYFGENSGIELVFLASVLLMFYKPKFFCFSYSSTILGLISMVLYLIFGDKSPLNVSIINLMMFVSIIHLVEGVLVMADGSRGAFPVFTTRRGKIIGGFALKRYWAMPVAIMIIFTGTVYSTGAEAVNTPEWWPLMYHGSTLDLLKTAVMGAFPFYGVIGYSSVTFAYSKGKKALISGAATIIYGMLMMIAAQLCRIGKAGEFMVLLFSPLAHEIMMKISYIIEERSSPIYISDEHGMCVLEVYPGSKASELGIRSGDKILEVNRKTIENEVDIYKLIKESCSDVNLKVKKMNGAIEDLTLTLDGRREIGLVVVPKIIRENR